MIQYLKKKDTVHKILNSDMVVIFIILLVEMCITLIV